jgi:hypothetical protein
MHNDIIIEMHIIIETAFYNYRYYSIMGSGAPFGLYIMPFSRFSPTCGQICPLIFLFAWKSCHVYVCMCLVCYSECVTAVQCVVCGSIQIVRGTIFAFARALKLVVWSLKF